MNLTFKVYNKTRKLAGITLQLEATPENTVSDIKNQIQDQAGMPLDAQWIIFGSSSYFSFFSLKQLNYFF